MSRSHVLSVSLAALLLVGGVNVASYAVNGSPLLLGRGNLETRTTTLRNTGPGPALDLRTRPGAPPLTVSSRHRIPHLNADRVDGVEGDALGVQAWTYSMDGGSGVTTVTKQFPNLPNDSYLVRYTVVAQLVDPAQPLGCHFEGPIMQSRRVVGTAGTSTTTAGTATTDTVVSLNGWGEVDARWGVTFTCTSPGAFDVLGGSQASFIRLNLSQVEGAVTTVP